MRTYAIFSAQYHPHPGGVESFTAALASALVAQGDRVFVVTNKLGDSPSEELQENGVHVMRLPCIPMMNGRLPISSPGKAARNMLGKLEDMGIERVLVNTRFYTHTLVALRFARRIGAPAIVLDHGSAHLTIGTPVFDWIIRRYEHLITRMVKMYHPAFAGISSKSVEWLRHFHIDTDLEIHNAIDAPGFRAISSGRNFRKELDISDESLLVAFVGRITPEKGALKLMSASKLLDARDFDFVFAGTGFQVEELTSIAPLNVHYVGVVNKEDLSALLQQSDLFCLPSRSEGFCTSLLEASAWAVPSIIPDVGGARELIPDESFGTIVSDTDARTIASALDLYAAMDPTARQEMGARVQHHAESNCSWEATVFALEHAFELLQP